MVEIMFVKQWVHGSYKERFVVFLQRSEERLTGKEGESLLHGSEDVLNTDPTQILRKFSELYPKSREQLLTAEDIDFFLYLCRER
jgi:fatty acid synthase subunit beta